MFIGDSHGDLGFLAWALIQADAFAVDRLVQVGDFGYWEHRAYGVEFLDDLNHALRAGGRVLHWVDGNHENHTLLHERYATTGGMAAVRSNIQYVPRGTRWEWGGVSFLGIGGAHSIDREWRVEQYQTKARYKSPDKAAKYELWWPEETITDADVEAAVAGGHVDVVVSHDAPGIVDIAGEAMKLGVGPWKWDEETIANRRHLTAVFNATRPRLWVHGHYHLAYEQQIGPCRFVGLDCNHNYFRKPGWSRNRAITVVNMAALQSPGDGPCST